MCWQAGGVAASQAGGVVEGSHLKQPSNSSIVELLFDMVAAFAVLDSLAMSQYSSEQRY
jgi:hypothetical protein